jgi:glycosidase
VCAAVTDEQVGRWWQHGVVYQVYPRSLQDTNGDGVGDLPGVIDRLDYLRELGVDALWLSPFYPSPMADFGYDVSNYCDVDPVFGTLADFDTLVEKAHGLDLRVIVDLVPNHSSDRHPWFVESRSSRDNPRRDWYVWRDGRADGQPPNNWLASFGGPAWTFDATTGQWYLHSFLPQQPDLNWREPQVRAAMFDVVRFWLRRGVDGFRVDVAHAIGKDPELRDNPPNPHGGSFHKALGDYETQLHVHDKNHPFVHEVYREFREVLDTWPDGKERAIIGEIHLYDLDEWVEFFGAGDEMHLPFNFGLLKTPWEARAVAAHVAAVELATALPDRWPTYVVGNHDEHRVASRIGAAQAPIAMLLLLTLRGTPTLYYGDELGHPDVVIPPEREQDPWGLRVPGMGLSRDPARTPMPWDDGPNGGFTTAGATPWLPMVEELDRYNVATQEHDEASMLWLTRRLLGLRRATAALGCGSYRALHVDRATFVYERAAGDVRVSVAVNLTDSPAAVSVDPDVIERPDGVVLLGTHRPAGEPVTLTALSLQPNEGVVIRLASA